MILTEGGKEVRARLQWIKPQTDIILVVWRFLDGEISKRRIQGYLNLNQGFCQNPGAISVGHGSDKSEPRPASSGSFRPAVLVVQHRHCGINKGECKTGANARFKLSPRREFVQRGLPPNSLWILSKSSRWEVCQAISSALAGTPLGLSKQGPRSNATERRDLKRAQLGETLIFS